MGKRSDTYLSIKDIQKANKHMKIRSTSYVRELQIKMTMGYYYTTVRMTKIQKGKN